MLGDALSYRNEQACVRVNVLYENGPEEVAIAGPFDSWRMRRHALQMHAMHLREKAFAATQSDLQAPPALVENGSTNELVFINVSLLMTFEVFLFDARMATFIR